MTNLIEAYWDWNGTSLHQYCWAIDDLTGRLSVPALRGSNQTVPYRRGQDWRAKVPDSRTMTLAMWLVGRGASDSTPTQDPVLFNDNWDALIRLFYSQQAQGTLTKRWRTTAGGLMSASALAEVTGSPGPKLDPKNPAYADLSVDVFLADPWFYAPQVSGTIAQASSTTSITNAGHEQADGYGMSVTFAGAATNPRLTNTTYGIWVQYTGTVASGKSVVLDIDKGTATHSTDGNVIGGVSHSGARQWMVLRPGVNVMQASGGGTATLARRDPYA